MTPLRSFPLVLAVALLAFAQPAPAAEQPPPDYLRPALEIGAGLAAGTLWYVIDERNVLDWDQPSIEQRLNGEAWRFDSNGFGLNYVWHPLAGSGMYVLARGNRLGVGPALVYSIAGSTLWEYAIEFNEKVSINDMLVTPLSGLAVGEFFHKLALHLSTPAPRGAGRSVAAWTLGLPVHGHRMLDGVEAAPDSGLWHRLYVRYGFGLASRAGDRATGMHALGFGGRFVAVPGYLTAGASGRWFYSADVASFRLELDASQEGVGVDADGETLLAGYHHQAWSGTPGRPSGFAATGAIAVAYSYRDTEGLGFDDRQGLLKAPGLALEAQAAADDVWASVTANAFPSFGSMSSLAFPLWRAVNDGRAKTVLERESYAYGSGLSSAFGARVAFRSLEIEGAFRYDRFWSIEGLDRAQERVERDLHGRETALSCGAAVRVRASTPSVEFGMSVERRLRDSSLSGIEVRARGERVFWELALPL